jgi:hypothetical protein
MIAQTQTECDSSTQKADSDCIPVDLEKCTGLIASQSVAVALFLEADHNSKYYVGFAGKDAPLRARVQEAAYPPCPA